MQGDLRPRTHLIQLYSDHPTEGSRLISDYHPQGIPIMIIVDPPSSCYCKLNLPHGIVSLEQRWGKFTHMMTPGWHCCYCSYKRIAAMVSKNVVQFNTPVLLYWFDALGWSLSYQRQCQSVSRHQHLVPNRKRRYSWGRLSQISLLPWSQQAGGTTHPRMRGEHQELHKDSQSCLGQRSQVRRFTRAIIWLES